MKIHMDYLEGKVEKFEKEQSNKDSEIKKIQGQITAMRDKLQLVKDDRDEKDGHIKKLRKVNEDLKKKLTELQTENKQIQAQLNESFHSGGPKDITNVLPQTVSGQMNMHHQMGGKQKYNSIDIGYDESNFDSAINQKNIRTNTNINSQKKILQPADILRQSVNSTSAN